MLRLAYVRMYCIVLGYTNSEGVEAQVKNVTMKNVTKNVTMKNVTMNVTKNVTIMIHASFTTPMHVYIHAHIPMQGIFWWRLVCAAYLWQLNKRTHDSLDGTHIHQVYVTHPLVCIHASVGRCRVHMLHPECVCAYVM